jgi:hypothetical protein
VSDTLSGFEAHEWNGVLVPHGTPPAIVSTAAPIVTIPWHRKRKGFNARWRRIVSAR